jgi:CrcB protein
MVWLAVAAGGAAGSLARHAVNILCSRMLDRPVPYATAVVNLSGALVIGLLAGLIASDRLHLTPATRAFVFVGILGGFTTFSSFMLDTLTLGEGGNPAAAFANLAGQTMAGVALVWAGYYFGHAAP